MDRPVPKAAKKTVVASLFKVKKLTEMRQKPAETETQKKNTSTKNIELMECNVMYFFFNWEFMVLLKGCGGGSINSK